jgi:hypothetical protein
MKNTIVICSTVIILYLLTIFLVKLPESGPKNTVYITNTVEKPVEKIVEKIVEKPVVEYLDKYITNVVEKIIEAEIPVEYSKAYLIIKKQSNSQNLRFNKIPKGVNKVRVKSYVSDTLKNIVSEEVLNNIMELELRKIGVAIDENADYSLAYTIDAFWNENKTQITYADEVSLSNAALVFSGGYYYNTMAQLFSKKHFGFVGKLKADQQIFNAAVSEGMIEVCNKILESRDK